MRISDWSSDVCSSDLRRSAQQVARMHQAAARLHQAVTLIRHNNFNAFDTILEMRFERVGKIMDIDHGALDASRSQPIEAMIDQRLPCNLAQRFGTGRDPRAPPFDDPGRPYPPRVGRAEG